MVREIHKRLGSFGVYVFQASEVPECAAEYACGVGVRTARSCHGQQVHERGRQSDRHQTHIAALVLLTCHTILSDNASVRCDEECEQMGAGQGRGRVRIGVIGGQRDGLTDLAVSETVAIVIQRSLRGHLARHEPGVCGVPHVRHGRPLMAHTIPEESVGFSVIDEQPRVGNPDVPLSRHPLVNQQAQPRAAAVDSHRPHVAQGHAAPAR
mmetsp:Transcript_12318/g.29496  ORF Transcript_12318/g.29496 Transcript_12318/m.29496 type:complete len:210 (-) Transcript_12318:380-1009(-)